MWFLQWDHIFLILYIVSEKTVNGRITSSCKDTIYINCNSYQIVILDVNTTSGFANDVLQNCNAQRQCDVINTNNECVAVKHWCKKYVEPLEIKQSSATHLKAKLPLINLMNEQFRDGKFSEAQNINCHLKVIEQLNNIKHLIKLRIFELTPSSNCTRFCLNVENLKTSLVCSNKQQLYTPFDDLNAVKDWHFNITVDNSKNCVSEVRFWIELEVNNEKTWYLDCTTSEPDIPELLTKPSANERFTTQMPERDAWSGSATISVSTKIAIALGTLLLLAVMAFFSVLCRKEKFSCMRKPSDENVPAPDGDHDYTYIDLDFIASVSRLENGTGSIPSIEVIQQNQPLIHMAGSRMLERELPPIPRLENGTGSIPSIEVIQQNQPLIHMAGSRMLERELPPIPSDDGNSIHTLHAPLLHRTKDDDEKGLFSGDSDQEEYLPPSRKLVSNDENDTDTETAEVFPSVSDNLNEIDALSQDNEDQESDDESYNNLPENEYIGLSQETLNMSDTSSKSSTGILYTLLDGMQRAEATTQDTPVLTDARENTGEEMNDDMHPEHLDGSGTELNKCTPLSDKDEYGYLVLLPGEVPSFNGQEQIQRHGNAQGAKVNTDEEACEHGKDNCAKSNGSELQDEKKGDMNIVDTTSALKDTVDEHGYLVLLPNEMASIQGKKEIKEENDDETKTKTKKDNTK